MYNDLITQLQAQLELSNNNEDFWNNLFAFIEKNQTDLLKMLEENQYPEPILKYLQSSVAESQKILKEARQNMITLSKLTNFINTENYAEKLRLQLHDQGQALQEMESSYRSLKEENDKKLKNEKRKTIKKLNDNLKVTRNHIMTIDENLDQLENKELKEFLQGHLETIAKSLQSSGLWPENESIPQGPGANEHPKKEDMLNNDVLFKQEEEEELNV